MFLGWRHGLEVPVTPPPAGVPFTPLPDMKRTLCTNIKTTDIITSPFTSFQQEFLTTSSLTSTQAGAAQLFSSTSHTTLTSASRAPPYGSSPPQPVTSPAAMGVVRFPRELLE
ncbi:hypothetical protein Pcinc_038664 [Petrolisthes cinctipes]|uniref:Uncharacterized protein n=1 Tax=Petrolisthes cinctipes TaxID=88211 RepID=A0AAE1BQK2_PETCI|nr:hypothetical protein Pcinc_038664 [Petrolisthes cinctipes]